MSIHPLYLSLFMWSVSRMSTSISTSIDCNSIEYIFVFYLLFVVGLASMAGMSPSVSASLFQVCLVYLLFLCPMIVLMFVPLIVPTPSPLIRLLFALFIAWTIGGGLSTTNALHLFPSRTFTKSLVILFFFFFFTFLCFVIFVCLSFLLGV